MTKEKEVKILAINGSYRGEKGYTAFLLDKLRQGVAGAGGEWETVVLAGQKINRCLSCGTCNRADHYLRCVFEEKDDVKAIFAKMAAADLIVFATHVYVFAMSALIKTILERLYSTGCAPGRPPRPQRRPFRRARP